MKYAGFFLTKESRRLIRVLYPPKHEETRYDHVTLNLTGAPLLQLPQRVIAYAHAYDDKAHVLLVEVDGERVRPDGAFYHVTMSYDRSLRSRHMTARIPDMKQKSTGPRIELLGVVRFKELAK